MAGTNWLGTPTIEGATTIQQAANVSNDLVVSVPSGAQVGDLLVAHILMSDYPSLGSTITAPSGWTQWHFGSVSTSWVSGYLYTANVYYRIVDGTETSTYTWSKTGSGSAATYCTGSMVLYRPAAGSSIEAGNPIIGVINNNGHNTATGDGIGNSAVYRSGAGLAVAAHHARITGITHGLSSGVDWTEHTDANSIGIAYTSRGWDRYDTPSDTMTFGSCEGFTFEYDVNVTSPKFATQVRCTHQGYGNQQQYGRNGVMLADGTIVLAYVAEDYKVHCHYSTDGGATWAETTTPFDTGTSTEHATRVELLQSSLGGGYILVSTYNNGTGLPVGSILKKWSFSGGDITINHSASYLPGGDYTGHSLLVMQDPEGTPTYDELVVGFGNSQFGAIGYTTASGFSSILQASVCSSGTEGSAVVARTYHSTFPDVATDPDVMMIGGNGGNITHNKATYTGSYTWSISNGNLSADNGSGAPGGGYFDSTSDKMWALTIDDVNSPTFGIRPWSADDDAWPGGAAGAKSNLSVNAASPFNRMPHGWADAADRRITMVHHNATYIWGNTYRVATNDYDTTSNQGFVAGTATLMDNSYFAGVVRARHGTKDFKGILWHDKLSGSSYGAITVVESTEMAGSAAAVPGWGIWGA